MDAVNAELTELKASFDATLSEHKAQQRKNCEDLIHNIARLIRLREWRLLSPARPHEPPQAQQRARPDHVVANLSDLVKHTESVFDNTRAALDKGNTIDTELICELTKQFGGGCRERGYGVLFLECPAVYLPYERDHVQRHACAFVWLASGAPRLYGRVIACSLYACLAR